MEKQLAVASKAASRFSFGLAIASKDGMVLAKAISNKGQTLTRILDDACEIVESDEDLYGVNVNSDNLGEKGSTEIVGTRRRSKIWNTEPKVFDRNSLGAVITGLPSDCRFVMDAIMEIATDHRSSSGASIRPGMLAERLASMFHKFSLQSGLDRRLLAVEVIIASRDELVHVDCSGCLLLRISFLFNS